MNKINSPAGALDAEELMFLALRAMEEDRDEYAIDCLKRGLALDPRNGALHHLLGAMYAQLGMIDRALKELTAAVTLAPEQHMARFQLGLLHFTSGDIASAETVMEPLSALPDDEPLNLFRQGILYLARDEFEQSIACLTRGLELNTEHTSLNHDMQLLAEAAQAVIDEGDPEEGSLDADEDTHDSAEPTSESGRHVLLSGYQAPGGKKPN